MSRLFLYSGVLFLLLGVLAYGLIREWPRLTGLETSVAEQSDRDVLQNPLDEHNAAAVNAPTTVALQAPDAKTVDRPRNVTPDGVLPGPAVTGTLARVAGPPLPETVQLPPPPARLFLITVETAGIVRSKGQSYILSGVVPTPRDAVCRDADDKAQPCGRLAATALSRFIRKRAIECRYPGDGEGSSPRPAQCKLGRWDVAEWLVSGGWTRTTDTAPDRLKRLEAEARTARRGLWRYDVVPSGDG